MGRFILRRIVTMIPVLLAVTTITFFLVRLAPGGPFDLDKGTEPQVRQTLEAYYHLDANILTQYVLYLGGVVRGDLGPSFKHPGYSVNELIAMSFPVSLELGLYALGFALLFGLTAGVIAAYRQNSWRDYVPMAAAMTGICVPSFVLGPLLILVFGLWLGWLPVAGWDTPADRLLPALTLGAAYAAYVARLTRGGMLETLSCDFVRTARAKGLSETRVVLRHAFRQGVSPVVAFLGPAAAGLLSGSFVVETIFQIPGLGRHFVSAAFDRDYTMITGTVLFYAALILVFNLLADIAQAWLDPRIRYDES